jgi:hypothetical protein
MTINQRLVRVNEILNSALSVTRMEKQMATISITQLRAALKTYGEWLGEQPDTPEWTRFSDGSPSVGVNIIVHEHGVLFARPVAKIWTKLDERLVVSGAYDNRSWMSFNLPRTNKGEAA